MGKGLAHRHIGPSGVLGELVGVSHELLGGVARLSSRARHLDVHVGVGGELADETGGLALSHVDTVDDGDVQAPQVLAVGLVLLVVGLLLERGDGGPARFARVLAQPRPHP